MKTTLLRFALAALIGVACPLATLAADGPPDPATVDGWLKMRAHLFGSRPITLDRGEVVTLPAPPRAQDAAIVPISISTQLAQTPERYLRRLYLLIDANPSPLGAVFTFTPESGRADIDTRVRVGDYVDARRCGAERQLVVHGSALCQGRGRLLGSLRHGTGTTRFRRAYQMDASVATQEPVLALMIQHPTPRVSQDQMTQLFIPAYFVRTVE